MHRTQIEIYSNLEADVCHDNKSKFSNEKKTYFSPKFLENLVPVALFTSAEKTQSKSKYRQFAIVLLAFLCEQTYCCWYFIESCLLFVCRCKSWRCFPTILLISDKKKKKKSLEG